ncbi:radical SAM protein [Virgisporangium aliadipatigenens]|uniref:Radical SAM protein n=1 Tax=Virgisporangium aliadipatigenens TaxID=741659 RepID=A0A8J3YQB9_9ACTN|nr:intein-containing Rv2578c family radical SAM protein [Virgisporangium aliadipatigenens]GIJ48517.1 radical SAM protein [Virgisporangium aliadipatigenens]
MRWDQLLISADRTDGERQNTSLPLALPGATVRTFDTPEFRGKTFYEVRARSIINRVPASSRMHFEWTVNPYRGCSHACTYCLTGDTPILMADGRTKPLADLVVGERIYGTVRDGYYRRYVVTEVLAHWQTRKPAWRVRLADGTTLVASADHRFLTQRGWKHVVGSEQGTDRRPHLTVGSKLLGVGHFADAPKDSADYRHGYLCGLVGTGGRHPADFHGEPDAMLRAAQYLARSIDDESGARDPEPGVHVGPAAWPQAPGADWHAGLLAGMFDAHGSCSRGNLRIATSGERLVEAAREAFARFGFEVSVDRSGRGRRTTYLRLLGGLAARLRFFHTTDPAVVHKRDLSGIAVKCDADLRVVSVEPLGLDLPMYDITTGTGDFIAAGVVSHNCFARNTHTYLDLDAGADFDDKVVVKVNAPDLLRKELARPQWTGGSIAMGTNVDCYQRAEGRYRLMPGIIAALRDRANPFSVLTKGTLLLRDLPLLREAASVTRVSLAVSVGFRDEELWRSVEPGAPSPARRLDMVRRLGDAGFAVSVLMAPILPGITDTDGEIDATVAGIVAAGAVNVVPIPLHLRPGAREWYLRWLSREFPHLLPMYRERYRAGAYLDATYQKELSARVKAAARRHGLRPPAPEPEPVAPAPAPLPSDTQLTLL